MLVGFLAEHLFPHSVNRCATMQGTGSGPQRHLNQVRLRCTNGVTSVRQDSLMCGGYPNAGYALAMTCAGFVSNFCACPSGVPALAHELTPEKPQHSARSPPPPLLAWELVQAFGQATAPPEILVIPHHNNPASAEAASSALPVSLTLDSAAAMRCPP